MELPSVYSMPGVYSRDWGKKGKSSGVEADDGKDWGGGGGGGGGF